jgi:hypothetical protein
MININSRDITTSEQKLLYAILQELKKLNTALNIEQNKQFQKPKEKQNKNKICKYCGERHEKPVDYAICAKKHKKEGTINDTSN